MNPAARLDAALAALSSFAARSDGRGTWDVALDALRERLARDPDGAARATLTLFEGERPGRGEVGRPGEHSLDEVSLTHESVTHRPSDAALEAALAFGRLKAEVYGAAFALWRAGEAGRAAVRAAEAAAGRSASGPSEALLDLGHGEGLWARRGGLVVRHDCGHFVGLWREDALSAEEAAQGALGRRHFHRLVIALQARLTAAGLDPWAGDARGLPGP